MRTHCLIIAAATAMVMGAALPAAAQESHRDLLEAARSKMQRNDNTGAREAAEAALKAASTADERCVALMVAGQAAERAKDYAAAHAKYGAIGADPEAPVKQKIIAFTASGAAWQKEFKFAEARAEYTKILALPDLPPDGRFNAELAVAGTYKLIDSAKTLAEHRKLFDAAGATVAQKIEVLKAIFAFLAATGEFEPARKELSRGLDIPGLGSKEKAAVIALIAKTYEGERDWEAARREHAKALAIDGLGDAGKTAVLGNIVATYHARWTETAAVDLAAFRKAIDDLTQAKGSPAAIRSALAAYAARASKTGRHDLAAAAWRETIPLAGDNAKAYAESVLGAIDETAQEPGKRQEARRLADAAAGDDKLAPQSRLVATLLGLGLAGGKDTRDLKDAMGKAADDAVKSLGLTMEDRAAALAAATKSFLRLRDNAVAMALAELHAASFRATPRNTYVCSFVDKAPVGVEAWMQSAIYKDPAKREGRFTPYQSSADLTLDMTVERPAADKGAASGTAAGAGTAFWMAADTRGWHVFIKADDPQAALVETGLAAKGSLEMYFAPGPGECYYQWMTEVPSGKTDFIDWSSPWRGYRSMRNHAKVEVQPLDKAFGIYLFFPWEALYDKLPANGDTWQFSIIRWAAESVTWGGHVHELGKFGLVQWAGPTPEKLTAIKRGIVMRALARYKAEKGSMTGPLKAGILSLWSDEELGDVEFDASVLAPLVARYDELGKKVAVDMSAADVDLLFAEAVPDWMEFPYEVAELRTRYLEDRLFGEAKGK